MRFGPREIILLVVLLALPLSSYWLVFRPQNSEILQAQQEITHKQEMLDKLREVTSQNESLEKANAEIIEAIGSIEARLPSNKEISDVVRQVSQLAVESGLQPPAMQSGEPVRASFGPSKYWQQPLEIELKGDFRGFYAFLLKLEQLPRITRIPDMKISRARDNDGHLSAEFTLTIYFEQEEQS